MGNETGGGKPRDTDQGGKPPHGQDHQPLPGESPSEGDVRAKRKHVQNADLPPGQGHQPLPGEDPPDDKGGRR